MSIANGMSVRLLGQRAGRTAASPPIDVRVRPWYKFTGLFIAAVLGLGILLSTIVQTQTQATQLSMMILVPFVVLSGFIFPIGGMPTVF